MDANEIKCVLYKCVSSASSDPALPQKGHLWQKSAKNNGQDWKKEKNNSKCVIWERLTYSGIGSHVVSIVKADEGKIGDMGGEGEDKKNSHHAGHPWPPQTQRPVTHTSADVLFWTRVLAIIYWPIFILDQLDYLPVWLLE